MDTKALMTQIKKEKKKVKHKNPNLLQVSDKAFCKRTIVVNIEHTVVKKESIIYVFIEYGFLKQM